MAVKRIGKRFKQFGGIHENIERAPMDKYFGTDENGRRYFPMEWRVRRGLTRVSGPTDTDGRVDGLAGHLGLNLGINLVAWQSDGDIEAGALPAADW